jgi:hypothetical protein
MSLVDKWKQEQTSRPIVKPTAPSPQISIPPKGGLDLLGDVGYVAKRFGTGMTTDAASGLINAGAAGISKAIDNSKDPYEKSKFNPITAVKDIYNAPGVSGKIEAFGKATNETIAATADSFWGTKYIEAAGKHLINQNVKSETHRDQIVDKVMSYADPLEKISQKVVDQGEGRSKFTQLAGNTMGAVGGMLPAIGASALTGNPTFGLSVLSTTAGGSSAKEAYKATGDINKAWNYGVASGLLEYSVESLTGGIPLLGEGLIGKIAKVGPAGRAITAVSTKFAAMPYLGKVVKMVSPGIGEGVEELISGFVDPYLRRAFFDPDASNATKEELFEQFAIGGLAAMVLRAGTAPGNMIMEKRAKVESITKQVNALNDINEGFPTEFREPPMKVTSQTTQDDVKVYVDKIVATSERISEEIRNRDDLRTPIREDELDGRTEASPETQRVIAAQQALDEMVNTIAEYAGIDPITSGEAALDQKAAELGHDLAPLRAELAEAKALEPPAPPKKTAIQTIEDAIEAGTAEADIPQPILDRYYAQKKDADMKANPIVYAQDTPYTKSEYKDHILEKRPGTTDAEFEEIFAMTQFENRRNDDVEAFVDKTNKTFGKYGVTVEVSYDLQENQNGTFNGKTITLNGNTIKSQGVASYVLSHEITHYAIANDPTLLAELKIAAQVLGYDLEAMNESRREAYEKQSKSKVSEEYLMEESIADIVSVIMRNDSALTQLSETRPTVLSQIKNYLVESLQYNREDRMARKTKRLMVRRIQAALEGKKIPQPHITTTAGKTLGETMSSLNKDTQVIEDSIIVEGGTAQPRLSLDTHNLSDTAAIANGLVKAGFDREVAVKYLKDLDSLAATILGNRGLYDYKSSEAFVPIKPNSDHIYIVSMDFSTLCKKRYALQATINAIQSKNGKALSPAEIMQVREALIGVGVEVSCGMCYVDSARLKTADATNELVNDWQKGITRKYHMKNSKLSEEADQKIKTIRNGRKILQLSEAEKAQVEEIRLADWGELPPGVLDKIMAVDPKMMLTSDGQIDMAENHDEIYKLAAAYVREKSHAKGVEGRAAYAPGMLQAHKKLTPKVIEALNQNAGMRWQSWSDFEAVHLMDAMQAIADMSEMKLKGHMYTKVPDAVMALGRTGMMINLSLVPKGPTGLDADGNLIMDNVEGMDFIKDAMRLRDLFPNTTGTIAIGVNDAHILKMMADPRIDFIIPYHISGLSKKLREITKSGLAEWEDYTPTQSEKGDGKSPLLMDWWDYTKTGNQNTISYLNLARKRGLRPKFFSGGTHQNLLLTKKGEAAFEAGKPILESEILDGGWKLLIDRKMFNGATPIEQQPVKPIFDNDANQEIMAKYTGGHDGSKAVGSVVDQFTKNSLAYHAGDLGKAEYLQSQLGSKRGTGHFGTGTYFVGDRMKIADGGYANRPQHAVELDGYNLYKPTDRNIAETLHEDVLKFINRDYLTLKDKRITQEMVEAVTYGDPDDVIKSMRELEVFDDAEFEYQFDMTADEYLAKGEYRYDDKVSQYLRKMADRVKALKDNQEISGYKQKTFEKGLNTLGLATPDQAYQMLDKIIEDFSTEHGINLQTDEDLFFNLSNISKTDSLSTRFMKALGYEGVDVRHIKQMDNTTYGSVVYDLKGDPNTKNSIDQYFEKSVVRNTDGSLKTMYHGTPDGNFNEFKLPDYLSTMMSQQGAGFYFTDKANAKQYTKGVNKSAAGQKKLYEVYLNITNPIEITKTSKTLTRDQVIEIVSEGNYDWFFDGDLARRSGKEGSKAEQLAAWVDTFIGRGDAAVLSELTRAFKGGDNTILEAMVKATGKDGVKFTDSYGDIWVAWNANQIKNVDNTDPTSDPDIRHSLIKDKDTLAFLENQKGVRVFRAMQVIDGKLYPPMAAKVAEEGKRKLVMPSELGVWEQANERADLIKNGKFTLDKANGSSITASYNPYYHTSRSPLNDQFLSAQDRANLVVVEGELPESELTSGYRAPHAKDAVGEMSWHSGPVSSKLPDGKKRQVILSRWFKPLRIVPDSEVARSVSNLLDGENISIPENVVTPSLREELQKLGVPISEPYGLAPKKDAVKNSLSTGQQQFFKDSKALDTNDDLEKVYHGTLSNFWEFSKAYGNPDGDMGAGFYFTNMEEDVWANYANENGADVQGRIERHTDMLTNDGDIDYDDAMEEAKAKYLRGKPRTIEAYLNMKNPIVLSMDEDGTFLDYNEDYDAETEEYGEPSGSLIELIDSVKNVLQDYEDGDRYMQDVDNVLEDYLGTEGDQAWRVIADLKSALGDIIDYDSETNPGNEIVRQALEDMGFDGVIDRTVATKFGNRSGRKGGMAGVHEGTTHYIAFSSNQAKEVTNENPTDSPDIRHSLSRSTDDLLAEWEAKKAEFGTKKKGEVPERIDNETRVSDFMENAYTAPSTPEGFKPDLQLKILSGIGSYAPISDVKATAEVDSIFARRGLNGATEQWRGLIHGNRAFTKADIVLGERLLVEAAERGDQAEWNRILADLCVEATRAGQVVQAFSMLKKMTPEGRAYSVNRLVAKLQADIDSRGLRKKVQIVIDPKLLEQLSQATTLEQMNAIEELIIKDVAVQIPPRISDRVVAWRYLSMLGNPRTHVRNLVSNAMMWAVRRAKDGIGAGMENFAAHTIAPNMVRTKTTAIATPEATAFAKQDFLVMRDTMSMGGFIGFDSKLDKHKKSFGNGPAGKVLNFFDKINNAGLEGTDIFFMKVSYVPAFTGYMTINKLTAEFLQSGTKEANHQLAAARAYAVNEGLTATYRQASTFATWLNELEKKNVMTKLIVGGLMPFKKTPINIVKTGLVYSPAGLFEAIVVESFRVKSGQITPAQYIDRLASGFTGSMAFGFGVFLQMLGVMKAGGGNDKEEYYEQMQGSQPYSVTINGRNYTLDWLTPISMPLMAGVEFMSAWEEQGDAGTTFNRILAALLTTADPLTELSMLQGINQAVNSFEENKLGAAANAAVQSYVGQFVPTVAGQATRFIDPVRRTTYAPKDTNFPGGKPMETFANKIQNKAFMSTQNEPYIDQWGREEVRPENLAIRAFETFVAPYYAKDIAKTPVDDELARIFAVNENKAVLPGTPGSKIAGVNLSPSDYTEYKRKSGQEAYKALDMVIKSYEYKQMTQTSKEKVIADVFDYARDSAKADYAEKKKIQLTPVTLLGKVDRASEAGIDVGRFLVAMQSISEMKSDVDKATGKGTTKDSDTLLTRKTKVINYLKSMRLSDSQIKVVLEANGYKVD